MCGEHVRMFFFRVFCMFALVQQARVVLEKMDGPRRLWHTEFICGHLGNTKSSYPLLASLQ